MKTCCEIGDPALQVLRGRQARVLWIVFGINALMFLVEIAAGVLAHSTALLADAVDMLGDALVYGVSLYALNRSERWRASAALLKGGIMAAFAAAIGIEAGTKLMRGIMPDAAVMGALGFVALCANLLCLVLLMRHRGDDLNMRSTWLCSRNDVVANVGVLAAAAGVALTQSAWPDVLVGVAIAAMFSRSAVQVIRASVQALRASPVRR
jgi:cation diffusion facilitator family transporter